MTSCNVEFNANTVISALIDVDEDAYLSIGEVFKMIYIIEKNFVLEQNFLTMNSSKMFNEVALKRAYDKFKVIITKKHGLDQIDQRFLNQTLIGCQELSTILKELPPEVWRDFLPKNIDLPSFLSTRFEDPVLVVDEGNIKYWMDFMSELDLALRGPKELQLFPRENPVSIISKSKAGSKVNEDVNQLSAMPTLNNLALNSKKVVSHPKSQPRGVLPSDSKLHKLHSNQMSKNPSRSQWESGQHSQITGQGGNKHMKGSQSQSKLFTAVDHPHPPVNNASYKLKSVRYNDNKRQQDITQKKKKDLIAMLYEAVKKNTTIRDGKGQSLIKVDLEKEQNVLAKEEDKVKEEIERLMAFTKKQSK